MIVGYRPNSPECVVIALRHFLFCLVMVASLVQVSTSGNNPCVDVVLDDLNPFKEITSARYPSDYPVGDDSCWVVRSMSFNRSNVQLVEEDFDVEESGGCTEDYLRVYDVEKGTQQSYCGQNAFGNWMSGSAQVNLEFKSNLDDDRGRGFNITARITDSYPDKAMSTGAILGIVLCCLLMLASIFAVLYVTITAKGRKRRESTDTTQEPQTVPGDCTNRLSVAGVDYPSVAPPTYDSIVYNNSAYEMHTQQLNDNQSSAYITARIQYGGNTSDARAYRDLSQFTKWSYR